MTFAAMDMSSLADPSARNTFETNFKQGMADSAGVTADMVVIDSITAGSVRVASTVYFPPTATVTPVVFSSMLSSNPAAMFPPALLVLAGNEVEASDLSTGVAYLTLNPPPPLVASASMTPPSDQIDLAARPTAVMWALLAAILAALLAA